MAILKGVVADGGETFRHGDTFQFTVMAECMGADGVAVIGDSKVSEQLSV